MDGDHIFCILIILNMWWPFLVNYLGMELRKWFKWLVILILANKQCHILKFWPELESFDRIFFFNRMNVNIFIFFPITINSIMPFFLFLVRNFNFFNVTNFQKRSIGVLFSYFFGDKDIFFFAQRTKKVLFAA